MINTFTGLPVPTAGTGTFSSKIDIIGPTVTVTGNARYGPNTSFVTVTSLTLGAIFRLTSSQAGYGNLVTVNNSSPGLYIKANQVDYYSGSDHLFQTLTVGTPYFVAASTTVSTGTATLNVVTTNLNTGQISSGSASIAGGASTVLGQILVGSDAGSEALTGAIAAAMVSTALLTPSQLLAWAQDPWSFWYPQRIDLAEMLNVATVGVPLAAGLLQTRNVPGLGPRSRHTALLNAALPTPVAVVTVTGGTLPIMGVG